MSDGLGSFGSLSEGEGASEKAEPAEGTKGFLGTTSSEEGSWGAGSVLSTSYSSDRPDMVGLTDADRLSIQAGSDPRPQNEVERDSSIEWDYGEEVDDRRVAEEGLGDASIVWNYETNPHEGDDKAPIDYTDIDWDYSTGIDATLEKDESNLTGDDSSESEKERTDEDGERSSGSEGGGPAIESQEDGNALAAPDSALDVTESLPAADTAPNGMAVAEPEQEAASPVMESALPADIAIETVVSPESQSDASPPPPEPSPPTEFQAVATADAVQSMEAQSEDQGPNLGKEASFPTESDKTDGDEGGSTGSVGGGLAPEQVEGEPAPAASEIPIEPASPPPKTAAVVETQNEVPSPVTESMPLADIPADPGAIIEPQPEAQRSATEPLVPADTTLETPALAELQSETPPTNAESTPPSDSPLEMKVDAGTPSEMPPATEAQPPTDTQPGVATIAEIQPEPPSAIAEPTPQADPQSETALPPEPQLEAPTQVTEPAPLVDNPPELATAQPQLEAPPPVTEAPAPTDTTLQTTAETKQSPEPQFPADVQPPAEIQAQTPANAEPQSVIPAVEVQPEASAGSMQPPEPLPIAEAQPPAEPPPDVPMEAVPVSPATPAEVPQPLPETQPEMVAAAVTAEVPPEVPEEAPLEVPQPNLPAHASPEIPPAAPLEVLPGAQLPEVAESLPEAQPDMIAAAAPPDAPLEIPGPEAPAEAQPEMATVEPPPEPTQETSAETVITEPELESPAITEPVLSLPETPPDTATITEPQRETISPISESNTPLEILPTSESSILTTDSTESGPEVNSDVFADYAAFHAFAEHKTDYGDVTFEEFKKLAIDHIENPDAIRYGPRGRTAFWKEDMGSVLIRNEGIPDKTTMFKPNNGRKYFDTLKGFSTLPTRGDDAQ